MVTIFQGSVCYIGNQKNLIVAYTRHRFFESDFNHDFLRGLQIRFFGSSR